jgi:tRNA dimethylallyltransferase
MDIGTAKATAEERAAVPHHLLDLCEPSETLTLAEFQELAYAAIETITARGRLPFLVGGTGLYVRAVAEGYGIPRVPPDETLRAELFAFAGEHGHEALHARLAEVDPESAAAIDSRNVRRVARALEVYQHSGIPISVLQRKEPPPYRVLQIGLSREREVLYERVDRRIQSMLEEGLVEEVRRLLEAGVPPESESLSGLGYRETVAFLRGEIDSPEALAAEIGRNTRRFIRTQGNWFRAGDESIHWFDLDKTSYKEIEEVVAAWLGRG